MGIIDKDVDGNIVNSKNVDEEAENDECGDDDQLVSDIKPLYFHILFLDFLDTYVFT